MTRTPSEYEVTSDIMNLDISDGLKKALIKNGFTRKKILSYSASELAANLAIDEYVALIILEAAND